MLRVPVSKIPNECVANALLSDAENRTTTEELRLLAIPEAAAGKVWAVGYSSLHDVALQELHGALDDKDVREGLEAFKKMLKFEGRIHVISECE